MSYASPFSKPQLELDDPADAGFARLRMKTGARSFWDIAVGTGPGANLAEPFAMPADIPKGSVVIIDDENPGRLKLSERAYDTRVAGIVSGANGINTGL